MNSLLLGLALSAPQTAVAHPPRPVVFQPAPVVVAPPVIGRPAFYPPFAPGEPYLRPPHGHAMTLEEFARCFRPTPGTHHVCLIHPVTCRPVEVCFTLPPGCPRVRVSRREIEFDYGRREVEIQFRRNGRVEVDY